MGQLAPEDDALLALVYVRKNETYPDVAAGFWVGLATAWRYTQEVITLLAAQAPTLNDALEGLQTTTCSSSMGR